MKNKSFDSNHSTNISRGDFFKNAFTHKVNDPVKFSRSRQRIQKDSKLEQDYQVYYSLKTLKPAQMIKSRIPKPRKLHLEGRESKKTH